VLNTARLTRCLSAELQSGFLLISPKPIGRPNRLCALALSRKGPMQVEHRLMPAQRFQNDSVKGGHFLIRETAKSLLIAFQHGFAPLPPVFVSAGLPQEPRRSRCPHGSFRCGQMCCASDGELAGKVSVVRRFFREEREPLARP
jgi:hypothetical protein